MDIKLRNMESKIVKIYITIILGKIKSAWHNYLVQLLPSLQYRMHLKSQAFIKLGFVCFL